MAVPDLKDAIDHLQRRDLDAAIAALEHKIEELPAHLTAHVLLARTYETKHQWTKALNAWENVHFLMPNSPVGQEGKARVLRRLDRHEEAADAAPKDAPASSSPAASSEAETGSSEAEAPPPPSTDSDRESPDQAPSAPPPPDDEPPSELQQLRQQAEEEARRGGARPDLAAAASGGASPEEDEAPSPEERVDDLEEEDDLDRLIGELQSAEIEPDPDADVEVPTPDLDDDVDDLVSETLARIHEAQNQYRKAAQIYVKLASQEPDRAREHLKKAARMRERIESSSETD